MWKQALLFAQLAALAAAWMPKDRPGYFNGAYGVQNTTVVNASRTHIGKRQISSTKIRGVNLGSMFIIEPWMASAEWSKMGCGNAKSEFDCVSALGQQKANAAWATHWSTWITETDLDNMKSYGLNTVRVPLGYWIQEDLVYADSEHFPQGGLAYLDKVVGWASDRSMFIILDLHGAPGAQDTNQSFTGQYAPSCGFYQDYEKERAIKFLSWMTNRIHTNNAYRGVGMIEVVNEPDKTNTNYLTSTYYPAAVNAIRGAEKNLSITADKALHVQMMDGKWGSGDPTAAIKSIETNTAYDDHRYVKYDTSVAATRDAYLKASCHDDVSGNWPLIVGEWSLSPADEDSAEFDKDANKAWYTKWWAAQVMAYESQDGWVFWSWKTDLGDYRWDYQAAVSAGVIPKDLSTAHTLGACNGI